MKRRVVICGGAGGEAWLAVRAWRAAGSHDQVCLYCDDPQRCGARANALGVPAVTDRAALFDDPTVATVHVLGGVQSRDELVKGMLRRGLPVVLAPPLCERPDTGKALAEGSGPGRLLDGNPFLHFPALGEGLRRARGNRIGRLQQVRMRSLIAGEGGWDAGLNPDCPLREAPRQPKLAALLRRELATKLPIAEAVLGPVVEIQVQAPRREPPCSLVAAWRHAGHAHHGILELTVSPVMSLRSPFAARDDTVEITGTAGILWVGRFQGSLDSSPSLRIYRGATLLEPEPPPGGWPGAWEAMARQPAVLDATTVAHRTACLAAVDTSLETGERAVVGSDEART